MSEKAEGIVYLVIGALLCPSIPVAAWFTVSRYWLAWGLVGILMLAVVISVALTSVWSLAEGYGKVTA